MPALQVDGLSKTYDRVRYVLEDLELVVQPGEIVVLMGRSGSGKTTLLNILAALEEPTAGSVTIGDSDLFSLEEQDRADARLERVGIVFQRFHLIPELTVAENVGLPMRLAGRKDRKERTKRLIRFFGIQDHEHAFPATLSGGETQRAAIARALGNEPRVLLADEPTANLDEGNARNALSAFERVAEELGTAVVIATHDPLVTTIAHRLYHLVDGRLHPGDPERLARSGLGVPTQQPANGDSERVGGASASASARDNPA